MTPLKKNSLRMLVASLVFLLVTLFCNVAKAGTLTDDISNIFNFINTKIVAQIKNDFCKQYIISISDGEWKDGELRTDIGKKVCTSYSVPDASSKITKTSIQTLNGKSNLSVIEIPSTTSVNNPVPDVFVPSLITSGTDLNTNQIISLTNSERKKVDSNLVNLQYDNILTSIATIRVKDMFANSYFEHISPTGDNVSKEASKNGYTYITIGENIALGSFDGSDGLVTAWMNSPGHRANILNKNYTEIGVYVEKGTYQGQVVWIAAQIFGKPITGCTEPDKTLSNKIGNYKISADSIMDNIKNIDAELKLMSTSDTKNYNAKVAERNTLAGLYNNLASQIKDSVAEYNAEVTAFNACIKTI